MVPQELHESINDNMDNLETEAQKAQAPKYGGPREASFRPGATQAQAVLGDDKGGGKASGSRYPG
jgi:hypothetical protein